MFISDSTTVEDRERESEGGGGEVVVVGDMEKKGQRTSDSK